MQKELERTDQTFEERKHIIDKMMEINKMKGDKDSENKKFLAIMAFVGVAAVGIVGGVLSSALGGNTKIEMQDNNYLSE